METFRMLTKVIIGENCIYENRDLLKGAGKRAAVIAGKNSAQKSGALDDVKRMLDECKISCIVIPKTKANPDLDNVSEMALIARDEGADIIIGIGGGSPMDAAKAVALLCTNDIDPDELFTNSRKADPLPLYAVPTTAGTGSEVTPYSVLTIPKTGDKQSFADERVFPRIAFLDHRYTETMDRDVTVDTAADAFSHAFEGYISKRATRTSDILAIESMRIILSEYEKLDSFLMDAGSRKDLLYASMLAGIVISQTGTTLLHGLGYALTCNRGISHGRANGMLFPAYLRVLYGSNRQKLDILTSKLGLVEFDMLPDMLGKLFPNKLSLTSSELDTFVDYSISHKSINYTPADFDRMKIRGIFESVRKQ